MKVRNNKFIIFYYYYNKKQVFSQMRCFVLKIHRTTTRDSSTVKICLSKHTYCDIRAMLMSSLVLSMIVVESWNIYRTFVSFIASLNGWENSENCFSSVSLSTMMFNAMMCKISSICLHAHKLRKDLACLCFSLVRIVGEKQKQIKFYVIANDNYVNFLPLYFFIESVSLCTPLTTEKIEKFSFHPRHDESNESSRWLVFIRQQSGSSMRWQHCDSKS